MCLIVFNWCPDSATPLRLAANRDEFYARPSAALNSWPDAPGILGGRDLQAGGSWLAAHERGRLVAVTNVHDPEFSAPADGPSRGELVRHALECQSLPDWLEQLAQGDAMNYAGFNLLASDGKQLWHLHHSQAGTQLQAVSPGMHGLANANLNTSWPKLERCRARLAEVLSSTVPLDFASEAWALLADNRPPARSALPATGTSLSLEDQIRFSSPFIIAPEYGTRASTWVEWQAHGALLIGERSFGPEGRLLDEQQRRLAVPPLV